MADFITANTFEDRLRQAITAAWAIFCRKVGGGLIPINKEASMQLQYAYILRQLLPLISHTAHEIAEIELETGVTTSSGSNEIDILLKGESSNGPQHFIAIELKCYRKLASSGLPRGAPDLFMKDVYADLAVLEEYVDLGINRGVALVMTDHELFVNPKRKTGKCWNYDISNGVHIAGGHFNTPIGGEEVSIHLSQAYTFNWSQFGEFWFMELEGTGVTSETSC